LETENLDPSNIKQLQLELQQSGSIFIDDIKLVFHTPQKIEPWMEEEDRPDPLAAPVVIFGDGFINDNGWGLVDGNCHTVRLSSEEVYEGAKSLYAKWKQRDECEDVMTFGASWNKWFPVNFEGNQENFAISLQILKKGAISESLDLYIGLQDYDGRRVRDQISVTAGFSEKDVLDAGWTRVEIPLSTLEGDIDYSDVKMLFFEMQGEGEVYLDNIRLVRLKAN
jgi:hypothetical protein